MTRDSFFSKEDCSIACWMKSAVVGVIALLISMALISLSMVEEGQGRERSKARSPRKKEKKNACNSLRLQRTHSDRRARRSKMFGSSPN
jgi:hypothetical protein